MRDEWDARFFLGSLRCTPVTCRVCAILIILSRPNQVRRLYFPRETWAFFLYGAFSQSLLALSVAARLSAMAATDFFRSFGSAPAHLHLRPWLCTHSAVPRDLGDRRPARRAPCDGRVGTRLPPRRHGRLHTSCAGAFLATHSAQFRSHTRVRADRYGSAVHAAIAKNFFCLCDRRSRSGVSEQ